MLDVTDATSQKLATVVVQAPEKFRLGSRTLVGASIGRVPGAPIRLEGWPLVHQPLPALDGVKPHRVRYWLNPNDPDFDAKAAKICKLYISPPVGTTVLCVDEKPGVQALRRTRAARPMRRGRPTRLEFEYERKGTRNIFAAFNIRDGRVLLWVTADRTTPMVLSFLDHIVAHYRRGPIVIITDNISTRTGDAAAEWLAKLPRVRFVFTPTHGSWLNQVEI
jgi:hypothetical protein